MVSKHTQRIYNDPCDGKRYMRSKLHVVIGASGGLGSAILRQLASDGNDARGVVHRLPGNGRPGIPESVELVQADALDGPSMLRACEDASVVYHTVNVPYQEWEAVMPLVTSNILSSAEAVGAKLVFPGNVYGYGRFEGTEATEGHPLGATSRKGQLRNALERTLMEAHHSGRVKVVVPRFPDFYGPNVTNRIFGGLFLAALAGRKASWIGKLDVPHDLVFVEDAARASVMLAETEDAYGQAWHIPGAGPVSGRRFIEWHFGPRGENQTSGC